MEKVIDLSTAWQGCCYYGGGCYNCFTDTDNRSCDSVFIILAIILYFLSWLKKRNDQ